MAGTVIAGARTVQSRLRGSAGLLDGAADLLAARVARAEANSRLALLGSFTPAQVAFSAEDVRDRKEPLTARLRGLIRFRDEHGRSDGDLESIEEFFTGLSPRRLVVLGAPGSGKTVMAIELVLRLLKSRRDDPEHRSAPVPVRLSLAGWDSSRDLEGWLTEHLIVDYGLPSEAAKELVQQHRVLPVLDGLDEMDPSSEWSIQGSESPSRALAALEALNAYADLAEPAPVILTCRAERYSQIQQLGNGLQQARRIRILDLEPAQIKSYISARFAENPKQLAAWHDVFRHLVGPSGAALRAALSTPWRLLLATTLTHAGRPPADLLSSAADEDFEVASKRIDQILLAGYVAAATRLTTKRPIAGRGYGEARYDPVKVTAWLRQLVERLEWQAEQARQPRSGVLGLSGIELVPHLMFAGPTRARVAHVSLIVSMAVMVLILAWATVPYVHLLVDSIGFVLRHLDSVHWGRVVLNIILPAVPLFVMFPLWTGLNSGLLWLLPEVVVRHRMPIWERAKLGITIGLFVGLLVGIPFGLLMWLLHGSDGALKSGLLMVFVYGFPVGLANALMSGDSWSPAADVGSPARALRVNLAFGLVYGFGAGVAATALIHISDRDGSVVEHLAVGFAFGLVFGLVKAAASVRYAVGLAMSAARGKLPWRLGSFLDWASRAGLLRVAGSAYQFRHLELQQWLRPEPTAPVRSGGGTRPRPSKTR